MKSPELITVTDEPRTPQDNVRRRSINIWPLAIASLVIGIAGIRFPYYCVCGLLAVIIGHIARRRIRLDKVTGGAGAVAIAGLTFGYMAIFAGLNLYDESAMIDKAKKVTSLATATALECAVNNFFTEYGEMPSAENHVTTDSANGVHLLRTLFGKEEQSQKAKNLRNVKFLSVKEGKNRKNGLIYNSSGTPDGLFDPWGNPYIVELDTDYDEHLHFTMGTKTVDLKNRRVAVYSPGKDKKPGTSDDVITW